MSHDVSVDGCMLGIGTVAGVYIGDSKGGIST